MKTIEEKVIEAYVPHRTSLRGVGRIIGIDHHRVKRILESNSIEIVCGEKGSLTEEHKRKIGIASKGRVPWSKGKKMPKSSLYKNMTAHLRFSVSAEWLEQFCDIEKLKFLNSAITKRGGRFDLSSEEYKDYLKRFYCDDQFNKVYKSWLDSGKNKWKRPTVDHVNPRSRGGANSLDNLQFLSWFENRAKCDMTQEQWDIVKKNIKEYLI
jgi:hypothetical protein